jgi:succinate dehydrogenase hydrophobic anchor subunit
MSRWLLAPERKRPTWHYEGLVAGSILFIVAALTSPYPETQQMWHAEWKQFLVTWLSMFAVFGSFLHAKVGYRMSEAMKASDAPSVSCHEWLGKYWLSKEILWFFVFLLSGAYPAIVGNVIFIIYPAWRKIHLEERMKLRGVVK